VKVPKQCPLVLPVKGGWKESKAFEVEKVERLKWRKNRS
jgi:hypothetical protein